MKGCSGKDLREKSGYRLLCQLHTENGDRIVTIDSVTSLDPMYSDGLITRRGAAVD